MTPTTALARPTAASAELDPRWRAVLERDRSSDDSFVYSVETTGVYCRPSCPSRRADPVNVRFHDSAAAAEKAGYRACLRCRPDEPSLHERHGRIVADACRLIERAETTPTLSVLAAAAGMSQHHFHRIFRSVTGVTPKAYAAAGRARDVRDRLAKGSSVTAAIHEAGFGSASRFYEQAQATLGMTPGTYRAGGVNAEIRFAFAPSTLGTLLVAATDKGICSISMGEDAQALLGDLERRFPRASLIAGDEAFGTLVADVVSLVEAPRSDVRLPLDIRGTAFQQRVWQALIAIPPGTTASYAEIARVIGAPSAVRAVAGACAANKLAVVIPCHRVVRSDGDVSGYRWGVERKRALLRREAENTPAPQGRNARESKSPA